MTTLNYDYVSNPKSNKWGVAPFTHAGAYEWKHKKTGKTGQQVVYCRNANTLDELLEHWNTIQNEWEYKRIL